MSDPIIDLRSDTVTQPTPGMRAAMAEAELGDDVYREDPTVNRLEEYVADLLGKEAALFVPSGSMSNQLAIKAHTQPGDEILCEEYCHIYNWEAGGPAFLSGVTCRTILGEDGIIELDQLRDKVRPLNDHMVRTKVVCLENTHNHGSGRIYPMEKVQAISHWAKGHGLIMHLDGARLWNAIAATGISARQWADQFDTVSVCFSKGLGAPVGSALCGPKAYIASARRYRKIFGGNMRQAGILAAGALYALQNHVERLVEDHAHAQTLLEAIRDNPAFEPTTDVIETNMVWFNVDPAIATAAEVAAQLKLRGVLVGQGGSHTMRVCTHLDVSASQTERAAELLRSVLVKPVAV